MATQESVEATQEPTPTCGAKANRSTARGKGKARPKGLGSSLDDRMNQLAKSNTPKPPCTPAKHTTSRAKLIMAEQHARKDSRLARKIRRLEEENRRLRSSASASTASSLRVTTSTLPILTDAPEAAKQAAKMDGTYSLSQQVTVASERENWQDGASESTPRELEPKHETLDAVQSAELLRYIEELNNAAARGAQVQFPRRRGWLTFISDIGETRHVPFATYDL